MKKPGGQLTLINNLLMQLPVERLRLRVSFYMWDTNNNKKT